MQVAEMYITEGGFGDKGFIHRIHFEELDKALSEYSRVAGLIEDEAERKNEKPTMVEVNGGCGAKVSLPLRNIRAIGLSDYALANTHAAGVKDAFPNIFKV